MNPIIKFILEHEGHGNAVPSADIEKKYGINERALRDLIVEAIEQKRELIGSSEKGYFCITGNEDYAVARRQLLAPFEKLKKRITALEFNYKINQSQELALEFSTTKQG